ncbi:spore germination protein [Desulfitobacterium sp. Sab5]|uniref:spore germination protein n=1 Tax=Desulfitobacterium nosdiversum TaxID=3375356 RepID=UPI003CED75F2
MPFSKYSHKKERKKIEEQNQIDQNQLPVQGKLSSDLTSNIETIQSIMGFAYDILVREFTITADTEMKAAVIFIIGMIERELINEQVIGALMLNDRINSLKNNLDCFETLKKYGIPNTIVKEEVNVNTILYELMNGNTILLLDQVDKVLILGSIGWKDRPISPPESENVIRGPKDGFTENIYNNTALIRRRIKSPDLRMEPFQLGTTTKTQVLIVYLEGKPKEGLIQEVRDRIERIEIDGVLESGYIEELIEDTPMSPFPQIEHTERPDKVSASILEGRVAILVDTTPYVLLVPTIFVQFIQSSDDYYERYPIGSLTRLVRLIAYLISVLLPAAYIALTSYHQEMIPTTLALAIAASREGVPFPSIGEALMMEATFEILREAGLRLPKQAGQAVSIVGGLVIGQAAVQAGIVSQAMVIVVALTGISSFAIPAFNAAGSGRMLRFPLMLLASILGLPGIMAGLSIILIHLNSLRSFGVNYMEPFISANQKYKDVVVRHPWWGMNRLPGYIARKEFIKTGPSMKPGPPNSGTKSASLWRRRDEN